MAKLASFRTAHQKKALEKGTTTIACKSCRKPLWEIKIHGEYGTKIKADKIPYPGVGRYEEYWTKDGQPKDLHCPFCKEEYFTTIQGQNGKCACQPYLPEIRD